jgi:SAM-dependent methyltransferase
LETRPRDVWRFLAATRAYSPNFNPPLRYVLEKKWDLGGRIDALFCPTRGLGRYRLFVTERVLELPFAHRALDQLPGSRILEFGCANSQLCIELASRGMMVTGVDLRAHPLTHPNFAFLQGDFFDQDFCEKSFGAVIAISAVEHVGLGAFGEDERDAGADRQLVKSFYRLLRAGGQLILTVPFGKWNVNPRYRIYDVEALETLLEGYDIDCEEYYRRTDHSVWLPATANELAQVEWHPSGHGAEGVALIAARRPSDVLEIQA